MLRAVKVRDFQSHDSLLVDFDPLVTVFVGPSDVGKSAVLRAIRWLATDRPLGDSYIRSGAEECVVSLKLDNCTVAKRKGKQGEYRLNGQTYKAWGSSGPPEPIQTTLNLGPVNWQGQHDPPFWFSLTAGEVAKQLNEIVDLDVIDKLQAMLATKVRQKRAAKEAAEHRLENVKRDALRLNRVRMLAASYKDLKSKSDSLFTLRGRTSALERAIVTLEATATTAEKFATAVRAAAVAADLGKAMAIVQRKLELLEELLKNARKVWFKAKQSISFPADLGAKRLEAEQLDSRRLGLLDLITKYREAEAVVSDAAKQIVELKDTIQKESGGVCPACGRPM